MRLGILDCKINELHAFLFAILTILAKDVTATDEWIYTVKSGDNLWNVTERHLKNTRYVEPLQNLNKIQNPYVIPPGTRLRIPVSWTKQLGVASAQVVNVHGKAMLKRDNQAELPIEQGMELLEGDEISSENDTFVTIEFADGSQLRIQENTYLRLNDMRIFGDYGLIDTLIELHQGRTENSVPKESDKSTRFRIRTPSAITSVRGTDFRVGVINGKLTTSSEVLAGVVGVSDKKTRLDVMAGYGTVTEQGKSPARPVKLLPPPDLTETRRYYQSLPLIINLKPLPGAQAYRAQIAVGPDFKNLWSEFTTVNLPFRDGDIPDGDYWLKIRGMDGSFIEGQDAIISFSLNARPEVPFIIAPLPEGVAEPERQEFKWAHQSEASHYAIVISQDSDFSRMVYSNPEVRENSIVLSESLPPGHYFWRIFSVSATEGAGPMSDAMPFRVPYPAPSLEETKLDEKEMTFAWRAATEGQSFHFQFSRDREFTGIIHDEVATASTITITKPSSGTYYLRMKTIEADGFQGPWGAIQNIEVPISISPWFMLLMLLPLFVLL
ncbi:MAG: LysM peptidoglycan-binding domain-containing protein [Nitrosomonas sp.]|nr:MAG: LysM peptidoglycan-binding domain-containing protein [Nitrosomonas sp.]